MQIRGAGTVGKVLSRCWEAAGLRAAEAELGPNQGQSQSGPGAGSKCGPGAGLGAVFATSQLGPSLSAETGSTVPLSPWRRAKPGGGAVGSRAFRVIASRPFGTIKWSGSFPVMAAFEARIKNTVRFLVEPAQRTKVNLEFFVEKVLHGLFGADQTKVFCLQDFQWQGIYDVTFFVESECLQIFEKGKRLMGNPEMEGILMVPSFQMEEKPLLLHMFNPFADYTEVVAFLKRYCSSVRGGTRQFNRFDYFNGKYKFWVRLKVDPEGIGGVQHPPANFSIGGNKGFLYYPGQPAYCRICLKFGHTKDECANQPSCRNCGESGHEVGRCSNPRRCDMW
ncbi:zinc finger CCHC domain-containing protein 3-like [Xenopus laevis]|uniref:Zinc finger CCHC domain-containing protein 3-like n=1 Tax=Xenopus laevis TaxID=8355 RepID=A0A8J1LN69_XENLA|nr:zinc finger CCHC domain-containing protein 3-like [Xenopus laevis]